MQWLIWLATTAAVIGGVRMFNSLPPPTRNRYMAQIQNVMDDVASKRGVITAIVIYFVLKFVYHVGLLGCVELAVLVFFVQYQYRKSERHRQSTIHAMQLALRNPAAAASVLGPYIPTWVTFPGVEKTIWLNTMVREMWPHMSQALDGTTEGWIQYYLDYYKPGFLSALKVSKCKFGPRPLDITGVEIHNNTPNETILDFHMQWNASDCDIRILAGMGLVDLEVIVCDLQLECVLRCIFGPYVNKWPCFAALSYSFVGKPRIDFQLKAARLSLDAIPGLSTWLDGFLRDTLSWCMVYPKRIVTPMIADFDKSTMGSSADPIGYLALTLECCTDLPKNVFMAPMALVETSVTGVLNESVKTPAERATPNPKFDATFKLQIYDKSATLRMAVYNTRNVTGDEFIGEATLSVEPIIDGKGVKHSTVKLADTNVRSGNDLGSITFSAVFTAYEKPATEAAAAADGQTTPRVGVESRARGGSAESAASGGGSVSSLDRKGPSVPRSRPSDLTTRSSAATLFVHLIGCANLKNVESIGKSDPYVVFGIGSRTTRSTTVPNCLDPVWWKDFKLDTTSASTDLLNVAVWDEERVGTDRIIGKVDIPLHTVLKNNGRMKHTWNLSPQGTITMELKLLLTS